MIHNKEQSTFEIKIDGQISELNYQIDPVGKTMSINRTYVPDAHRGQGIAGKLNKAALDYADQNDFKVIPVCSYTASYISKHSEYEHLLKNKV